WGAEAGIGTSRGFECNFKESIVGTSYSVEYDEVFRTYAIRILPVNFGYRHKFNDRWAIDGHVGVGLSYDFAGGNKTTLNGNTKETKIADVDSYRPFDAYLKIGFGASYKHVGLDISYQRGLNKLLTETEMYASNLTIGVRYIF
ncbi:MAG: outer membrane beta-barrel protein, partial [Bacteroidaceae bacterium]|nr:outer membrane beta-barrel protein [Bacteroidaceae bacterium]